MTSLKKILLSESKIPSQWYNIGGIGITDLKTVLMKEDDYWVVFYSERGGRYDESFYNNETDACRNLLSRIKELIEDYE